MTRWIGMGLLLAGCADEGWTPLQDVPFLEPREPVPELTDDQHRLLSIVVDISGSMTGLGPLHYAGVDSYVSTLAAQAREGDQISISLFAEEAATGDGTASINPNTVPWVDLVPPTDDLTAFWERVGAVCPECDGDPNNDSGLPTMGGCTNPSVGIRQAALTLAGAGDADDFRGMVVVTGHGFNCGGGLSEALSAAEEAYQEHGVHIWTIQPEFLGIRMDEVPYLTRGAGFFQFTEDPAEVPDMYLRAALGLPGSAR